MHHRLKRIERKICRINRSIRKIEAQLNNHEQTLTGHGQRLGAVEDQMSTSGALEGTGNLAVNHIKVGNYAYIFISLTGNNNNTITINNFPFNLSSAVYSTVLANNNTTLYRCYITAKMNSVVVTFPNKPAGTQIFDTISLIMKTIP